MNRNNNIDFIKYNQKHWPYEKIHEFTSLQRSEWVQAPRMNSIKYFE